MLLPPSSRLRLKVIRFYQVMLHGKSKSEMINRRLESHTAHLADFERLYNDASGEKDYIFYDDLMGNGDDQV